jgi:hypothetical protein
MALAEKIIGERVTSLTESDKDLVTSKHWTELDTMYAAQAVIAVVRTSVRKLAKANKRQRVKAAKLAGKEEVKRADGSAVLPVVNQEDGLPEYRCSVCGKRYANAIALDMHMKETTKHVPKVKVNDKAEVTESLKQVSGPVEAGSKPRVNEQRVPRKDTKAILEAAAGRLAKEELGKTKYLDGYSFPVDASRRSGYRPVSQCVRDWKDRDESFRRCYGCRGLYVEPCPECGVIMPCDFIRQKREVRGLVCGCEAEVVAYCYTERKLTIPLDCNWDDFRCKCAIMQQVPVRSLLVKGKKPTVDGVEVKPVLYRFPKADDYVLDPVRSAENRCVALKLRADFNPFDIKPVTKVAPKKVVEFVPAPIVPSKWAAVPAVVVEPIPVGPAPAAESKKQKKQKPKQKPEPKPESKPEPTPKPESKPERKPEPEQEQQQEKSKPKPNVFGDISDYSFVRTAVGVLFDRLAKHEQRLLADYLRMKYGGKLADYTAWAAPASKAEENAAKANDGDKVPIVIVKKQKPKLVKVAVADDFSGWMPTLSCGVCAVPVQGANGRKAKEPKVDIPAVVRANIVGPQLEASVNRMAVAANSEVLPQGIERDRPDMAVRNSKSKDVLRPIAMKTESQRTQGPFDRLDPLKPVSKDEKIRLQKKALPSDRKLVAEELKAYLVNAVAYTARDSHSPLWCNRLANKWWDSFDYVTFGYTSAERDLLTAVAISEALQMQDIERIVRQSAHGKYAKETVAAWRDHKPPTVSWWKWLTSSEYRSMLRDPALLLFKTADKKLDQAMNRFAVEKVTKPGISFSLKGGVKLEPGYTVVQGAILANEQRVPSSEEVDAAFKEIADGAMQEVTEEIVNEALVDPVGELVAAQQLN